MTKRRNPYFDDFEPQIKVHVGIKHLNNNNEEKMKSIYDKTIGMLFEAANQKIPPLNDNITMANDITTRGLPEVPNYFNCSIDSRGTQLTGVVGSKKQLKQTFFGKNGCLQKSGHVSIEPISYVRPCSVCSIQPSDPWEACGYCESPQCSSCSVVCIQCNKLTCSNCSFPCYNSAGSVTCVSCSR